MARQSKKPSKKASGKTAPKRAPRTEMRQTKAVPATVPVVGLGTSADGTQAIADFFAAMPDKTGMAFVVVHDADHDKKNLVPDLIAEHTPMKVALAQDKTRIAADHVYVVPSKRLFSIENGILRVTEPASQQGTHLPINCFFMSLALDKQQLAVAVILSGTGADGAAGIRSIKAGGGMVLVQDPEEAPHDAIPLSAMATGAVDHILPVAKMPAVISGYTSHQFVTSGMTKEPWGENTQGILSEVITVLESCAPGDFERYGESKLLRLIGRRMALRHMENAADYLSLLKTAPQEAEILLADLCLCASSFFRDPEGFEYLADHVIDDLVANAAFGQPIRVWVPACASGEDAYSLAILVLERIQPLHKDTRLQIFASDVDEQSLSMARAGLYPDTIAEHVSPERLNRFFDKEDHSYRVKSELRDAIVFANHNFLADAPFSKLDLILCQNTLVYLNAKTREQVIGLFHFALNDGGVLFLGPSRTIDKNQMLFHQDTETPRLYRRVGNGRHRALDVSGTQSPAIKQTAAILRNEELATLNTQRQQKLEGERRFTHDLNDLLSTPGIATLFLDRDLHIIRFNPWVGDLFNVITSDIGRPLSDIEGKIADPTLLVDAARVLETLKPVEAQVRAEGNKWFIRRIFPNQKQDGKIEGVAVTFADVTELKRLQQASHVAQKLAEAIVDTVREPMLVLDNGLNVVKASRSFLKAFQTTSQETEGKALFELQNSQWSQSALRDLLESILPNKTSVEGHEVKVNVGNEGIRTMLVNARAVLDDYNSGELILLALEDVTERIEIERGLKDREARLRAILDAAPEAIITADVTGVVTSYSPSAKTILGYKAEEVIGQNVNMLMPAPHKEKHDGYMSHYIETGEKKIIGTGREMKARHKDGSDVPIRLTVAEWWIDGERNFTGIIHDLTEDMRRREALQQAQKMEAVGQLTGGLAHDFNNLLTVIIGNLELLEMQLGEFPKKELLNEALEASDLGAKLTTQLLAFSRKQSLDPTIISLNDLVLSIQPLLIRTLGDDISVKTDLADNLNQTVTDPGQVENAILNLAINARDSMPEGGCLTIETRNVVLDADYAATQIDVEAGDYIALSVTDTGAGMSADVTSRAFDPFFTTKGVGAGSGLGLSMVYGFAKQSGGHAAIYSEEGVGTTVTLYLPPSKTNPPVQERLLESDFAPSRSETILVVEDDLRVQRLTITRLENLGYRTLAAESGPAALALLRNNAQINLILSDVVMPGGMTGFDVADQALLFNPTLKILLATGYASGAEIGRAADSKRHPVLRKPYSLKELGTALRALLD